MSTKKPFKYAKQQNELLKCKAPGCPRSRSRVGGYCTKHGRRVTLFGHYGHRKLQRAHYQDELTDCQSIIDQNNEHPGVSYAVKWLDLVLSGAATLDGSFQSTDNHLSRLYDSGITGYDVLLECSGVYRLYDRGHPKRIFSHKHLLYMLGLRTCLLKAPKPYKDLGGRSNRVIGTAINQKVGVLLRFISQAVDAREDAHQQEQAVMYEPLSIA